MAELSISRRHFLVAGGTVTGSFVLGLPLTRSARAGMTDGTYGERQIGYFVEITPAGKVIIGSKDPEIGQGRCSWQRNSTSSGRMSLFDRCRWAS